MMGMHIAAHGWREKSKEILAVENSQAISHLSPGNLDLYERDMYETKDPSVRQMHYEFWHDLGEMNKAVTIYNLTAEKRLLQAIDYSYHALEVVDIGLSGVSLFVTATSAPRIIWGTTKVHGTPDHMLSIARNAVAEQFDPDVKAIYVHKRLSDILKRPIKGTDYIPDLALEYHSGYFGIYEWRSPGQPYNKLLEKGWKYKEEMGSSLRFYDIKEIGQNIY